MSLTARRPAGGAGAILLDSPGIARPSQPAPIPRRPPRLVGGDALRAVAALGVVVIHAGHWPSTQTPTRFALWNAVVLLARFAVPAFVVLAGLALEYNRPPSGPEPLAFLRRRAQRTLVPWVAWAAVYLAIGWLVTGDVTHSAAGVAGWLSYGAGHLYFLLLIPQLYLLHLVWPRGLRAQAALAALALALQTALCVERVSGWDGGGLARAVVDWHGYQLAPFWAGYFAAGIVAGHLARDGVAIGRRGLAVVDGLALAVLGSVLLLRLDPLGDGSQRGFEAGTGAFLLPLMPVLVAGVVIVVLAAAGPLLRRRAGARAAVERISRDALGIYIVQAAVLYPIGRLLFAWLEGPAIASVVAFVLLVAAAFGLSMAATELLARTRLRFLVGL